MASAADLEKVLEKLLLPDNKLIQQATLELKTAFSNPDVAIPASVELLRKSTEPTIRQYCAILLRRRIVKQWGKVPTQTKTLLKAILLDVIIGESVAFVRESIGQVIASVAKHDLKTNNWPELMQLISCHIQNVNVAEREIGFTLLKIICETCAEQLRPCYKELFNIFEIGLSDNQSQINAFLCIRSLTLLLQFFGSDEEVLLKPMIGSIMEIIKNILKVDEDKANEALDIFEELVEIEVGIISPYVKGLVEFCMQIISCSELGNGIRIKSLYLICWACRRKSKTLLKSNLFKPLLQLLLSLLSIADEECDENEDDEEELNSLQSVAGQALDLLALNSPPGKIIPLLMEYITPMFGSINCFERKAAYIALGELAEGCGDHIRTKYLEMSIQTIMRGFSDESIHVRNASLFAFGQFSEFIQPEIGKYHENVLPGLLLLLETIVKEGKKEYRGTLTKLFYAIEKFTESLEKNIVEKYLNALINAYLSLLKSSQDDHTKELAISGIGALVTSAQEYLTPMFTEIMDHLKVFISQPLTLENLQTYAQTIDTIGALTRYINTDVIKAVAPECMELGIRIVLECEDPDLRRCTYGLFASVSTVLKEDMLPYIDRIGPIMIASLKSTEGIVATIDTSTQDPLVLIEDELEYEDLENVGDNEQDDDESKQEFSVENAYMEEKEDTINALVEIVENIGSPMMSSMKQIYNEIFLLTDYPHTNVRKASVYGGCRLCAVICKSMNYLNLESNSLLELSKECISSSLRVSANVINGDDERDVVIAVVEGLLEVFQHLKLRKIIDPQDIKGIGDALCDIISGKANCQQFFYDDAISSSSGDEDAQSELDIMLIEKCGDILPLYAKLIGGQTFQPYFNIVLPVLLKKMKKQNSVAEKSFAVGTLAEIAQAMGSSIQEYAPALFQCLLATLKDDNDEVRSNSAFALGVLTEISGENATGYYIGILECFHILLSTSIQPPLVQDNICGAIARMIMTSPQALPLQQVLSALVSCLPIKEDERENETATKCIINLYANNPDLLSPHMEKLYPWFIESLKNEKSGVENDTRKNLRLIITDIHQKFPQYSDVI